MQNNAAVGKIAPNFTLPSSEGKTISLKDYKNKWVILYFYQKDKTRGCTLEALAFKEKYWEINDFNAVVLAVSTDELKTHLIWAKSLDLPFPLLSDSEHQVAEMYNVWGQKTMFSKSYWGVERTTFLIDKDGFLRHIIQKTKPEEHPDYVLNYLKEN